MQNITEVWIRSESASLAPRGARRDFAVDRRTPLTPQDAALLIENGIMVTVERSAERIFSDEEYERSGCRLVMPGSYASAPKSALIIGLRPPHPVPETIAHAHSFFCHAFKRQPNWQRLLLPFLRGGSTLYDLEYLVDEKGNRLASFGQMAGAVGLAAGLFAWSRQVLSNKFYGMALPTQMLAQMTMNSVESLLRMAQEWTQKSPSCLVIGAQGRCGRGVVDFAASLGLEVKCWTRSDTVRGGPFPELLDYDIVINAIRINPNDNSLSAPWLTNELIRTEPRRLSVLVDISCEPDSPYNPFPLYKQATTFDLPTLTLIEAHDGHAALDLIAIPNLPSLLPAESSEQFSFQLMPLLVDLCKCGNNDVWSRAAESFRSVVRPLEISSSKDTSVFVNALITDEISFDIVETLDRIDYDLLSNVIKDEIEPVLYSILSVLDVANQEGQSLAIQNYAKILRHDDLDDVDSIYHFVASTENRPILERPVVIMLTKSYLALAAYSSILDQNSVTSLVASLVAGVKPKSSLQYKDYALWLKERLAELKAEKETDSLALFLDDQQHWKHTVERFSGHIVNAQFPTDLSVTAMKTQASLRKRFTIPISSTMHSYSMPVQILAAISTILYRYTLDLDFVFGTRVPFRNRNSLKDALGPFQERSILCFSLDNNTTVANLLEQCLEQWNGVVRHQELPLRYVVPNYISQSIEFILETTGCRRMELSEVLGTYQMCFRLWGDDYLSIDYDADVFLSESIIELSEQIRLLVSHLNSTQLNTPILELDLITKCSRAMLPDPAQPLDSSYPGPITKVFIENCVKTPNAIAISSEDGDLTYGQLNGVISDLAKQLRIAGVGRGDIVAIYGDRVPSVVWAIMGVLCSGAAFSMMDPRYPTERLVACLTIAQPRAWIAIESAGAINEDLSTFLDHQLQLAVKITLPPLKSTSNNQISASFAKPCRDKDLSANVECGPEIHQQDIAVVTFTSGSTGLPKGVCGRHSSLTHFYPWMGEKFGFSCSDHFSMCSGIAHDPLQRDIFTPLFFGARICIPSDSTIGEGRLSQWMHQSRITVSCLTPAMGQLLTASFSAGNTPKLGHLRAVFFVGDSLLKSDVIRLQAMAPNVACINMYGSTETQRAVGHLIVPDNLETIKDIVPVGVGMCDVQLLVVNGAGKLAAIGERGEIYVRSPHFAAGYLNLPEQTAEKFLPNRFVSKPEPHDRMYRTGDLGRYNSRGWVECSGRADDQVKIRGFRIELGEINARLSQHPFVKECVTIVINDNIDKRLASFVVLSLGSTPSDGTAEQIVAILRSSLQRSLPHYMVPGDIYIINSMPLTPNGKINRNALRTPERELMSLPPVVLTETQEKVLQVWSRLLPNIQGNIDADFFDLGGHSLLATRLIMELSRVFHFAIPLQTLFTNATIRSLSEAIDSIGGDRKCNNELQAPDLLSDVNYNWCSNINIATLEASKDIRHILLTGCTGFVGCFLLAELLKQFPAAQVYCTVRADSVEAGQSRIFKTLQNHMIWRPEDQQRIIPVVSDLSMPNFGWTEECFARMCSTIEMIVHNAAHVHWLLPYDRLRPVNVTATEFILKIAAVTKLKSVHYVSTTSVLETTRNKLSAKTRPVAELALDDDFKGLSSGYAQSKWVAEHLVSKARAKGISVSVYRLGFVTGDSRTGVSNTDDFLIRLIQGCIELGSCPFMEFENGHRKLTIDMSPVDYVSRTIVELIANSKSAGRIFHVTSPNPLPFLSFFQQIKDYGYDLVNLPYKTWRQKLLDSITKNEFNSLTPIVSHLSEDWADDLADGLQLDRSHVTDLSTTKFPALDKIVQIYLSYLVRCGSIPAPKDASDDHLQIDWNAITQQVCRITRTQRN